MLEVVEERARGMTSDGIRQEVVDHLRALIRFDTTNPPGIETLAAEYVAGVLAKEGIESDVLEYAPGRGSAVARWRGTGEDPPLLLMSHLDVVAARAKDWTHLPFAGEVADGYVWGRGAVDTKNATAIQMSAMLAVARSGLRLRRDLLLSAMADEEVGGGGARFLAEDHPEWVTAEYALNEGGGEALAIGGCRFYTFQLAQKGGVNVEMLARGEAGHSSVPYQDSAISKLSAAISRLKQCPLPHRVTDTARECFEDLAEWVPDEDLSSAFREMLDPGRESAAVARLNCDEYVKRMFRAMLRDTAEPTMLEAGYKANVIPSEAKAMISARGLPGVTLDELMQEIRAVVGEDVELSPRVFTPGLEFELSDCDELYWAARIALARRDRQAWLLPYLSPGGTDAMYLEPLGTKVIGFTPMRPDPAGRLLELAHGVDERIAVDNLLFGASVLIDTIYDLNDVMQPSRRPEGLSGTPE